jgi:adenylylsulfate kinase
LTPASRSCDAAFVVWLTGLSGAGKSTIATALAQRLTAAGERVEVLDGDEFRKRMSPELLYSLADRTLNVRRAAYVAELLARNGVIVIGAFVSPLREHRAAVRAATGRFVEVYVRCAIETARRRDPKGLYAQADHGALFDLSGVQQTYEEPTTPDLIVDTDARAPAECVDAILERVRELGYLG